MHAIGHKKYMRLDTWSIRHMGLAADYYKIKKVVIGIQKLKNKKAKSLKLSGSMFSLANK